MKSGDLVLIKLTGEIGMLLEPINASNVGYMNGWWVRLPDYSVVKLAEFEVKERHEQE